MFLSNVLYQACGSEAVAGSLRIRLLARSLYSIAHSPRAALWNLIHRTFSLSENQHLCLLRNKRVQLWDAKNVGCFNLGDHSSSTQDFYFKVRPETRIVAQQIQHGCHVSQCRWVIRKTPSRAKHTIGMDAMH